MLKINGIEQVKDSPLMSDIEGLARDFSALSSPIRYRIVTLLREAAKGGLGAGELAEQLALPPSTLSSHLATLKAAGLVEQLEPKGMDRKGRYILATGKVAYLSGVLERLRS